MRHNELILVTGAGGFIGGYLVKELLARGYRNIRAVDIKPKNEWYQFFSEADNQQLDLRQLEACQIAAKGSSYIFNLAADMGGMGFIELHKTECMLSVLINTHLLMAAKENKVKKYFFSSSACIYPVIKQTVSNVTALKESDAYPAYPEDGYGWEKLFSERMCRHFMEDYGIKTYVGRYHNVYGPIGTFDGGREKAPAALCRKVITAKLSGENEIEIWGDGEQTRSFTYIEDCIEATLRLMESDFHEPLNIGSSELITINGLVDIIEKIAGIKTSRKYNLSAPKGVRGRNSDNTLIEQVLKWKPSIMLNQGIEETYNWILKTMIKETVSV